MAEIFLVTGNPNKLAEWRRQLPQDILIDSVDVDLVEIQSADPEEIVADKARRAFAEVGKPVVVEDVSAGLAKLNGLPGPFIKFFMKSMGDDVLYKLAGAENETATVSCSIGYYDGSELLTVRGDVEGTFVPNGQDLTYAEMADGQKDSVSHRSRAIKLFAQELRRLRR